MNLEDLAIGTTVELDCTFGREPIRYRVRVDEVTDYKGGTIVSNKWSACRWANSETTKTGTFPNPTNIQPIFKLEPK